MQSYCASTQGFIAAGDPGGGEQHGGYAVIGNMKIAGAEESSRPASQASTCGTEQVSARASGTIGLHESEHLCSTGSSAKDCKVGIGGGSNGMRVVISNSKRVFSSFFGAWERGSDGGLHVKQRKGPDKDNKVAITEEYLLEDNMKAVPYKMYLEYSGVGIKAEHEAGYKELDYGGGKKLVILDKDITYIPLVSFGEIDMKHAGAPEKEPDKMMLALEEYYMKWLPGKLSSITSSFEDLPSDNLALELKIYKSVIYTWEALLHACLEPDPAG